jgi:hypothetical protein
VWECLPDRYCFGRDQWVIGQYERPRGAVVKEANTFGVFCSQCGRRATVPGWLARSSPFLAFAWWVIKVGVVFVVKAAVVVAIAYAVIKYFFFY